MRKTLADCLFKRSQETKEEFPNVTEAGIKTLVHEIERELFLHFGRVRQGEAGAGWGRYPHPISIYLLLLLVLLPSKSYRLTRILLLSPFHHY